MDFSFRTKFTHLQISFAIFYQSTFIVLGEDDG